MGLDWIAVTTDEDGESTEMFRGKGVVCDPNIGKLENFNCDDAYGECVDYQDGKADILSAKVRLSILKAIKKVVHKPVDEIDWETNFCSYEQWSDFMYDAFRFIQENKTILCWY